MGEIETYPHCELRPPALKPLLNAIKEIAERLGSLTAARLKLLEVCRAAALNAYWRKYDGTFQLITPTEWAGAAIDERTGVVILANRDRLGFVGLDRGAYEPWFESITAPQPALPAKVEKKPTKRGRPVEFGWDAIKQQCFEILEQRGAINPQIDPEWDRGKLESALMDWCSAEWNKSPADSTLRARLPDWITEWRATRQRGE